MENAIIIVLITFILMEVVSWLIHKYVMHGFLWQVHKTHHEPENHFFEKNDLFSLMFGSIAVALILLGSELRDYRFWIGIGITLYGFTYFILHDILIHKRIKLLKRIKNPYLNAISKAHRDHHKAKDRTSASSFGLLLVPKKYFKKNLPGGDL